MNKKRKEQIFLYTFVVFASTALGLGAREYALSIGVDSFVATATFIGITTVAIAMFFLLKMSLLELFEWLQNKVTAKEHKEITSQIEIPAVALDNIEEETKIEVIDIEDKSEIINENEVNSLVSEIKNVPPRQEIIHDMIFMRSMYDKFLIIEDRLKKDGYLTDNLEWISKFNGRKDIKSLIILLTGLIEKQYFMPNRDTKIKQFFEKRYNVSIGQNFERSRRQQYIKQYDITFYNYPF